jgi:hypothetical protein
MWFGTYSGAACYNGSSWQTYNILNSGIASNTIYAIFEDSNGNMKAYFPPTRVADHYFHSMVYLMVALEKKPHDTIFIPTGMFNGRH